MSVVSVVLMESFDIGFVGELADLFVFRWVVPVLFLFYMVFRSIKKKSLSTDGAFMSFIVGFITVMAGTPFLLYIFLYFMIELILISWNLVF